MNKKEITDSTSIEIESGCSNLEYNRIFVSKPESGIEENLIQPTIILRFSFECFSLRMIHRPPMHHQEPV